MLKISLFESLNIRIHLRQSHLVSFLIEYWSLGLMSGHVLQMVAAAAKKDGLQHPHVDFLARLGSNGVHERNIHRDLTKGLRRVPLQDAIKEIVLPIKHPMTKATVPTTQLIMLPHELFAILYKNYPKSFTQNVSGDV